MPFRRTLDAVPDAIDFRDLLYVPALVDIPPVKPVEEYESLGLPILDQGEEGACTGFGLAAVVNCLLATRAVQPDRDPVSPRMLYTMARRYDEWPGEAYDGSSARGAMKGWHKHGVCAAAVWPYVARGGATGDATSDALTSERIADASNRPLGAYFRVDHTDLVAMHAALAEATILYATAMVHDGWHDVGADGAVQYFGNAPAIGGHAFAIVGYDRTGFWVQNSWGASWGRRGFCHVRYDDWLANGTDVWVARLAAPVELSHPGAMAGLPGRVLDRSSTKTTAGQAGHATQAIAPHVITLGYNGQLRRSGLLPSSPASLDAIIDHLLDTTRGWPVRRMMLYAHGGLVAEHDALARIAAFRDPLLAAQVYPVGFVWNSDLVSTLGSLLQDAVRRRRPASLAASPIRDRIDDCLEPLARALGGATIWSEMKANAIAATSDPTGGVRLFLDKLAHHGALSELQIHLVGHSAGAIFLSPIVQALTGGAMGPTTRIASCTLWAPACTVDLFKAAYLPAIRADRLESFNLFTLTDDAERADDCLGLYYKSLLYLVSHAFEAMPRDALVHGRGTPLLGLARDVAADADINALFAEPLPHRWTLAPGDSSNARHHGDFDDDLATLRATLASIVAPNPLPTYS